MTDKTTNLRSELILAGLNEINRNGIANFSFRRVASACNVSCAAPYRHFKDKNELIAAIIDYVNEKWAVRQDEILRSCSNVLREQIIMTRQRSVMISGAITAVPRGICSAKTPLVCRFKPTTFGRLARL